MIKKAFATGRRRNFVEVERRATRVSSTLTKLFPDAKIVLKYASTWELLVSVILSAQCTDKKVNEVTSHLFKKYRSLDDYVSARAREFELDIKPTGFYRAKTRHILGAAKKVKSDFGGEVPGSMKDLLTLPGVARKTANVVLGNAFGIVEGIAVDTHVRRLALKLALTKERDPVKIERDLMAIFPKREWFCLTYQLIEYGRTICPARKHECRDHPLSKIYPRAADTWPRADGRRARSDRSVRLK